MFLGFNEYQEPVGECSITTSTPELGEQAALQTLNETSNEETVVEQNPQVEVLESYFSEQCVFTERPKQVRPKRSNLWSQTNHDDLEAIENEQISPECMEEHHRIHPTSNKRRAVNPNMYNPRKVCMIKPCFY